MAKRITKQLLSIALVVVMLFSLMPQVSLPAYAAGSDLTGFKVDGLTVACDGGTWTAGANSITGSATGTKMLDIVYIEGAGTLVLMASKDAVLKFDYDAVLNGGTITVNGETLAAGRGTYELTLESEDTVQIVIKTQKGNHTSSISITNISFVSEKEVTTTFIPSENGTYTENGNAVTEEYSSTQLSTTPYVLNATPAAGYRFVAWYSPSTDTYLSTDANASLYLEENQTVTAVFCENGLPLFEAAGAYFADLNAAVSYAQGKSASKITLVADGTLPAGDYTIPAGITLLIPFDEVGTLYTDTPGVVSNANTKPVAYRTLTMDSGANITVSGAISVSAKQSSANGGQNYGGSPTGNVGFIKMNADSKIVVESGGALYAWGFITGSGSVRAKSGASVYEDFQIADFRGGKKSLPLFSTKCFVFSQYYIQNIETELTLESGASEYVYTSLYALNSTHSTSIRFVGDGGMFSLASGSEFKKHYDPSTDRVIFEIDGDAALNSLSLTVAGNAIDSKNFNLPINNNITLKINSGTTTVNQDVSLQPGVHVYVAEGATLKIASGMNIYVYDADQWDNYAMNAKFKPVAYSPTRAYTRTNNDIVDAIVDVNGTVDADGFIYTTASGAAIISSEGSGVIKLNNGAGTATTTVQCLNNSNGTTDIAITPAQLKNGDGTFTQTTGAKAGDDFSWSKAKDMWTSGLHVHSPAEAVRENVKDATCTTNGSYDSVVYCSECREEISRETVVVDVTGHSAAAAVVENEAAATCTKDGSYDSVVYCSKCGEEMSRERKVIEATGHTNKAPVIENEVAATCTNNGSYDSVIYCSVCGDVVSREQKVIAKTDHTPKAAVTENVKAATCTKDGSYDTVIYCAECKGEISRVTTTVQATGHSAAAEVVENEVNATCTKGGSYDLVVYCSVCKDVLSTKHVTTEPLGHSYTDVVTAPTCTERGYTTHTCTVCGDKVVDSYVDALDHSYTNVITAPTCTERGYTTHTCTVCGDEVVDSYVDALGHSWDDGVFTAPTTESAGFIVKTCTACDETEKTVITEQGLYAYGDDLYFLNENGYAVTGLVKAENGGEINYYYFDAETCKAIKATEERDDFIVENNNGLKLPTGIYYAFGTDGVIKHFEDTSINGIYNDPVSGNSYYCIDGVIIGAGLIEIDGDYYYARTSNGVLVTGRDYWVTVTNGLLDEGTYTFDESGKIVFPVIDESKNGIYEENGTLYYYENGVISNAGLVEIDGDYYYVRTTNGEVIHGRSYWITVTNELMPEGRYEFDEDGKMINPPTAGTEVKSGIVSENGSLYYYIDGDIVNAGLIQIDGDYYYVRTTNGEVVHDRSYWITVTNGLLPAGRYDFGADGKLILK